MTGSCGDLHWPEPPSDVTTLNRGRPREVKKGNGRACETRFKVAGLQEWVFPRVPVDKCWQFMRNMLNCSWISFYEWINHNPKKAVYPDFFNILRAFPDDSDKPLFRAMPLSRIIVLCFSMTLRRNGTPGLEKQLITWIVAGKWTMTQEWGWIPMGWGADCLFVWRCWLSCHVPCPLCQINMFISPPDWYPWIHRAARSIQAHTRHARRFPLVWGGWELSFLSDWATE